MFRALGSRILTGTVWGHLWVVLLQRSTPGTKGPNAGSIAVVTANTCKACARPISGSVKGISGLCTQLSVCVLAAATDHHTAAWCAQVGMMAGLRTRKGCDLHTFYVLLMCTCTYLEGR